MGTILLAESAAILHTRAFLTFSLRPPPHLFFLRRQEEHVLKKAKTGDAGAQRVRGRVGQRTLKRWQDPCLTMDV